MHILYFVVKELLECSLVWQLKHIRGDKQVIVHACNGIFHHFFALTGAEQDSHRGIVAFVHLILLKVRYVSVELAKIFMTELIVL